MLTNLEKLEIVGCCMLKTIQIKGGVCRSLSSLLEEDMTRANSMLKERLICLCPELELTLTDDTNHHCKFLQHLKIDRSCDSLKSFPLGFFPNLRSLNISECRDFESLSAIDRI